MTCISATLTSSLSISWTSLRICKNTPGYSSQAVIVYPDSNFGNRFSAPLIITVIYGCETKPRDDPFVKTVTKLTEVLTPARAVVQMSFPFGEKFALDCALEMSISAAILLSRAQMVTTSEFPILFRADETVTQDYFPREKHSYSCKLQTSLTIHMLILASLLHPEVQTRARADIDVVCGRDKIPTFHHRNSLPYIEAICHEILRWAPVVPLTNLSRRAMGHNEEVYPTHHGKLKDEPTYNHFGFAMSSSFWKTRLISLEGEFVQVVSWETTPYEPKDKDGKDVDVKPEIMGGIAMLVLSIYPRASD
ncbi:hypothetical protein K503DRAFT_855029 [Rhizopogon vinicolor AM-OR11-026]|uniref:Cytochrome P450 n=1 Tax=Rhizopogon vinicolor AM-OR11-026 TaxID=1314800 RepID=A0A1B7N7V4_9AGAM|nr:hypothetical protein K503DRAFT_855029 [Rhizopogon vinicolor AM-OR11-026]